MTRDTMDVERTFNRARSNVQNAANTLAGLRRADLDDLVAALRDLEQRIGAAAKAQS